MGKITVEARSSYACPKKSQVSTTEMDYLLGDFRCGRMDRAALESTVGLPLKVIERKVWRVNFMKFIERR